MSLMPGIGPNRDMMSLHDFASRYKFPKPVTSENSLSFKNESTSMVFSSDSRKLLFNNTLIWMNTPVATSGNRWLVDKADITTVLDPLLRSSQYMTSGKPKIIVIDPGHGGNDEGAKGARKSTEKILALDIARRTSKKLAGNGLQVKLTRTSDRYLSLKQRSALAESWNADVFISIHLNHAGNKKAAGIETYIMTPPSLSSTSLSKPDKKIYSGNKHDTSNTILAYLLHRQTLNSTSAADRGIKHARFSVIRDVSCPAVLIECGFLSCLSEEAKISTPAYRDRIAQGIATGILNYTQMHKK